MSLKSTYNYPKPSGAAFLRVIRTDNPDGTKAFFQQSFNPDTSSWLNKAPTAPLPLFNSVAILANQGKPLIHAEGEKSAISAGKYFPSYIHTTSAGGSNGAKKTDFSLGNCRDILLTGDNDVSGHKYLNEVGKLYLDAGATRVDVLENPKDSPLGFDIADCFGADDPTKWAIIPFVYEKPSPKPTKKLTRSKPSKLPKNASADDRKEHRYKCYVEAAIANEKAQLSAANEGSRNNALNTAAFNLKKLANSAWASPFICESVIKNALRTVSGHTDKEVTATLNSAFKTSETVDEPEDKPFNKPSAKKTTPPDVQTADKSTPPAVQTADKSTPLVVQTDKKIPEKFIVNADGITTFKGEQVYDGLFQPVGVHVDTDTGNTHVDIEFTCENGNKTVTVAQNDLATRSGIIKALTSKGAYISESNAYLCCDYIRQFLALNRNILPTNRFTRRLGLHGDMLVLPHKTVNGEVEYRGDLQDSKATDQHIYCEVVKEIFGWGDEAWVLVTMLGYSLLSPFIKKLRIKRNPILLLTGASGGGKTTSARFVLSVWGDGSSKPFCLEGSQPCTPVSFSQNVAGLNGLPMLFDEVNKAEQHKGRNVIKWTDASMSYANGTKRSRGSKDNEYQSEGGGKFTGVLFGTGEIPPKIDVEGVFNRIFNINATEHAPMGVQGRVNGKQNPLGHERAARLEDATDFGSGVFGGVFCEHVLENWDKFEADYLALRKTWGRRFNEHTDVIALCIVTITYLVEMLGIDSDIVKAIENNVSSLFADYQRNENNPAIAAANELMGLIGNCTMATRYEDGGHDDLGYYEKKGTPVYWVDNGFYVVPVTNEIIKSQIGDIKQFYAKWAEIGFIKKSGKDSAHQKRPPFNLLKTIRCLLIPIDSENVCSTCSNTQNQTGTLESHYIESVPVVPVVPVKNLIFTKSDDSADSLKPIFVCGDGKNGGTTGTTGTSPFSVPLQVEQATGTTGTTGTTNDNAVTDNSELANLKKLLRFFGSERRLHKRMLSGQLLDEKFTDADIEKFVKFGWVYQLTTEKDIFYLHHSAVIPIE